LKKEVCAFNSDVFLFQHDLASKIKNKKKERFPTL